MYHTYDLKTLNNYESMVTFIKASILGELKYFWEGEQIPKEKFS
jgi:hypothetical protein